MWQRKQTLFLIIAIIILILTAFIPYAREAKLDEINHAIAAPYTSKNNIILSLGVAAAILACGIAIALFKNRPKQMMVAIIADLLCIGVGITEILTAPKGNENFNFSFGVALPFVASIFCILAFLGIKSDQKLVKSIDRLRD